MIKRILLTALLYLSILYTSGYLILCYAQWEIIMIPPLWDWREEERIGILGTYFCLLFVAAGVEHEIKDKRKRQAQGLADKFKGKVGVL